MSDHLKILFQNNRNWAIQKTSQDPHYFKKLSKDQDPLYLWIGCSDSRVPANEVLGLEPGELLVHRNVANIFPHTDFNGLSVLEFAVNILKVEHVIICGHYGCGGVKAAMEDHHLGLVDNWLRHIRDVYAQSRKELEQLTTEKLRFNRLVELSVIQQVLNVCHTTIIQEAWFQKRPVTVHGWVYDLETGLLKNLDCCFSSMAEIDPVYRVQMGRHDV